jgi:dTDP-4-amino-4,6-dideoxygalactose transaminase
MLALRMIRLVQPLLPSLDVVCKRLAQVWDAGQLTNRGSQVILFEERLKERLGCADLSVFCNGTMALLLGLRALDLQGEVITTAFTFPATVNAIDWAGLTPVFCDIDPTNLGLDPARVEAAITDKTSAILAVHMFGVPCDVLALSEIATRHGLKLIFDAAHAFDVEVHGKPIGAFGDATMFSFHATKLFHTAEGGALAYRDPELRRKLHLLNNFGIENEDEANFSGINGKLNEVQAALGLCVLDILDEERRKRASVTQRYLDNLARIPGVQPVQPGPGVRHSYQYMAVTVDPKARLSRDEIFARMRARDIVVRRYPRPLCNTMACYQHLSSALPANLPQATRLAGEVLCLPLHGALTMDEIDLVCDVIRG